MNLPKALERLNKVVSGENHGLLVLLTADLVQELSRARPQVLADFREAAAAALSRLETQANNDHRMAFVCGGLTVLVEAAAQGTLEQAQRASRRADTAVRRDPLNKQILTALLNNAQRTPTELAADCGVRDLTQISRALRALKAHEYVREVETSLLADRREKPVRLTSRGLGKLQAEAGLTPKPRPISGSWAEDVFALYAKLLGHSPGPLPLLPSATSTRVVSGNRFQGQRFVFLRDLCRVRGLSPSLMGCTLPSRVHPISSSDEEKTLRSPLSEPPNKRSVTTRKNLSGRPPKKREVQFK